MASRDLLNRQTDRKGHTGCPRAIIHSGAVLGVGDASRTDLWRSSLEGGRAEDLLSRQLPCMYTQDSTSFQTNVEAY